MKKAEVHIGGVYYAKVSGRIVSVRLLRESPYGGNDLPIFVYSDPTEYADVYRDRLLALGCSEFYAQRARRERLERCVRVASADEATYVLRMRAKKLAEVKAA